MQHDFVFIFSRYFSCKIPFLLLTPSPCHLSFAAVVFFPPLQSLDEDCTLEEEDDGLIEEEDAIDQFNDDTFGAGAIGKETVN